MHVSHARGTREELQETAGWVHHQAVTQHPLDQPVGEQVVDGGRRGRALRLEHGLPYGYAQFGLDALIDVLEQCRLHQDHAEGGADARYDRAVAPPPQKQVEQPWFAAGRTGRYTHMPPLLRSICLHASKKTL